MLVMRAAIGPAAMSSSRSVAGRPGLTSVPPEITRGLPVLVVAANTEVQERGLLKHARIARSINAALRERGADELTARLGAEVGMLAFTIAVERWMEADNDEPFPLHAAAALSDLQVRAADLDSRSRLSA